MQQKQQVPEADKGDNHNEEIMNGEEGACWSGRQGNGRQSTEEVMASEARFSINRITVFKPVKPLEPGPWNPRPVNDSEWRKLKAAMKEHGIKPFKMETMIPIVIKPSYIDPDCISNGMDGQKARELKLSIEGKKRLKRLVYAGGRHRLAAVKSIREDLEKEVKNLKPAVKKLQSKNASELDAAKKELVANLKAAEAELADLGQWGVILYDQGESSTVENGDDYAKYVLRESGSKRSFSSLHFIKYGHTTIRCNRRRGPVHGDKDVRGLVDKRRNARSAEVS